jgi:tetratricopeptide (TPR) repeat protein
MRALALMLALALLPSGSAGAEGESEADATAARAAFADGNAEFKAGRWQAAAEAWQRGYRLKADPVFLYNIAQAYRQADAPDKALFYYRNYLRESSAEAPNRAQVEERVAQLEKLLAERANGSTAADTTVNEVNAHATTANASTIDTANTSVAADHAPNATAATADSANGGAAATVVAGRPPRARRIDVEADGGVGVWAAGVPSGTSPSFVVGLGAGYSLRRWRRVELRVGGRGEYTMLREAAATDSFIALYAAARARVHLVARRLFADGELGAGAQLVTGLAAGSALLAASSSGGTVAGFALRPSLMLEARATDWLAFRGGVSLAYATVPSFAASSLVRVDFSLAARVLF